MLKNAIAFNATFCILVFSWAQDKQHQEMLYPTVRVTTEKAGGSGSVVFSGQNKKGEFETYVLTNHHVIEECISIKEEWDGDVGELVKRERRQLCNVEFFFYNTDDTPAGGNKLDAEVVAYDAVQDWALLKLRATFQPPKISLAALYPKDEIAKIRMFDEVFAIGAALGHAPIATKGMIAGKGDVIDHYDYWLSTAQIIYGNSGGAIYRFSQERKRYEYIGIPSRAPVVGWGSPVTHMGYFVPISRIYAMLKEHCYDFIYDSAKSIEQCAEEREAKRQKARDQFVKRRGKTEAPKENEK